MLTTLPPVSNADCPTKLQTGELVFAKPWEEDHDFSKFLAYLIDQEHLRVAPESEVRYAQTRKSSLPASALEQTPMAPTVAGEARRICAVPYSWSPG